jgi:hypothetical protein
MKNPLQKILFLFLTSFQLIAHGQCDSAGSDTSVFICVQQPFTLNSFLSPNAALTGEWDNSLWETQINPNVLGTDTLSFNFPSQFTWTYIVNDTSCNTSDTATVIINFIGLCDWGINESASALITIYPNPTSNGVFTLSEDLVYTIEDATGKQINQITESGVYFIVVRQKRYKLINL